MDNFKLIRPGDRGPAVEDVQARLHRTGFLAAIPGDQSFDEDTVEAVREFQTSRRIGVDGIVGPDTWAHLLEAGWILGDRVLYERRPWLRGDDVAELQERLAGFGFDVGKVDGIFGPLARAGVTDFQRNAGLATDGIAGPTTVRMLRQMSTAPAGAPRTAIREWSSMTPADHSIEGVRVFLDPRASSQDPGVSCLGDLWEADVTSQIVDLLASQLRQGGAIVHVSRAVDESPTPSERAGLANWFGADLVVSVGVADPDKHDEARVCFFRSPRYTSDAGKQLATVLSDSITAIGMTCHVDGATSALLRETRAVAVQCELSLDASGSVSSTEETFAETANALSRGLGDFFSRSPEPVAT